MNDYVTDPALLAQLNGGNTSEYVTDPALLAQLNSQGPEPGSAVPIVPYLTGPGATMPPGAGQFAKDVGTMVKPVGQFAKEYAAKPGLAALDLLAGSMLGAPPKATVEGAVAVGQTYKNVQDYLNKSGQFARPTPPVPTTPTGPLPDELAAAQKIVGQQTPAQAMRTWQTGGQVAEVAGGKAAQEGATFIERMAAKFAPLAQRVAPVVAQAAPVLNTVSRVAGPAGLAYNAYEAGQFARNAQLGQRLAQGEGRLAQAVGRDVMLNRNISGYVPSKQEAANLLASGDERTINIYGGRQRLEQIAGQ